MKDRLLKAARYAAAGAIGALISALPELASGLPDGAEKAIGALLAALLLYAKRP